MKLRGTKYVWSQHNHFIMLYYARKQWATCVMDSKGARGVVKFEAPTPTPFGTRHHDRRGEILFCMAARKGWHYNMRS